MGGGNTKPSRGGNILDAKETVTTNILSFFGEEDIFGNFCYVSKKFNERCNSSKLWEILTKRTFSDLFKGVRKEFKKKKKTNWKQLYMCLNSFKKSNILKDGHYRLSLNDLYGNRLQQWRHVYSGTRDGFDGEHFHKKCDDHKESVVVIESENGSIFGGFSPEKWHSYSSYSWNPKTFLFSLRKGSEGELNPIKLPNNGKFHRSIYGAPKKTVIFGFGPDLEICGNANEVEESFSNLGESFTTEGLKAGTQDAKEFFTGSEFFKIKEMEIFQRIEETKVIKMDANVIPM